MTSQQGVSARSEPTASTQWLDLTAIVVCTLCWGTTWFAITLQLGVVDPVVSVVYRFAFAAALLFAWCALRGEKISLTRAQHAAAFGVGFSTFTVNYTLVYWAEGRVTSAVVAVVFATMAFANLIGFRIAFGQRPSLLAWAAASLGVAGVGLLAWEEIASAQIGVRALTGILLTLTGVAAAVIGNIFARRGEVAGASVAASTAWAMAYGAGALALFALAAGKIWSFQPTWAYLLSFLHLAVNGSVVAFLMYYGLARRRGYATASYVSALAPMLAMLMSSLFEGKTWGLMALGGVVLTLTGQALLLRARRA
ncbi:MAG: EamA family transporter [Proteobacteria bacterium]|nr:EamA family transporter [Pseudomonadota bacterium]